MNVHCFEGHKTSQVRTKWLLFSIRGGNCVNSYQAINPQPCGLLCMKTKVIYNVLTTSLTSPTWIIYFTNSAKIKTYPLFFKIILKNSTFLRDWVHPRCILCKSIQKNSHLLFSVWFFCSSHLCLSFLYLFLLFERSIFHLSIFLTVKNHSKA